MSVTLLQSYLTNLRLNLQSLEYLRVSEIPKLKDLDVYIRIKADGYLENFVTDSNVEFAQGEILIVLNKTTPTQSTAYRNTKPKGSIVKHENFDVTSYWHFFTLPENYSKTHVTEAIKQIEDSIENDFFSFDINKIATDLSIAYSQASGRSAEDNTDANKLILEKVINLRDRVLMRLAYELNSGSVQLLPVAAHRIPLNEELLLKLKTCPWLTPIQLSNIIKSTSRDGYSYIHPAVFNFSNLFTFVYVKSDEDKFIITPNKIYDVTNVDKTTPRFFTYVK
jgi:hypothetical protein